MIRFKRKQFTIQEGHYTGPKDMDKVPGAIEVIGKSALAGTGIGAGVGAVLKDSTAMKGAMEGGKYGTIAGIFFKIFLNYLHNPMSSVKFQEVDKLIRREFGVYRMAGVTVGDSLEKRTGIDEKFAFNDRHITDFRVNFCIQNNQVTMYTFGMTDSELQKTSDLLDYYCKKYVGMEYTSSLINRKLNAYSVAIIFTNYQVISNFVMELSKTLEVRINLLDNKALADNRIFKASLDAREDDEEEKEFSFIHDLSKYEVMKIITKGGTQAISGFMKGGVKSGLAQGTIGVITAALGSVGSGEIARIEGVTVERGVMNNKYLKETLKKLHYIDGVHFTCGDMEAETNMSLISGVFVITDIKNSKDDKEIYSKFYKKFLKKVRLTETDNGTRIYTYIVDSRKELENMLNSILKTGITINIFEK